MKKIFVIAAFMLSFGVGANAQENEVYIQLNPTKLHADGADGLSPFGIAAGYNRYFNLGNDNSLKLIAGAKLNYAWKNQGINFETTGGSVDWKFMKIVIPVSIGYRFQVDQFGIMPYAGIDASFYPLAKIKSGSESANLFDEDEVTSLLKANRFQMGLQIGADFDYKNFVLGVAYQSDFTKFQDNRGTSVKVKTYFSEVEIKLGYRF